jgi:hypothetical protein
MADQTALSTRGPSFLARPLVRGALFVSGLSTFAGDLTLLLGIHRCEAAIFRRHRLLHEQRTTRTRHVLGSTRMGCNRDAMDGLLAAA